MYIYTDCVNFCIYRVFIWHSGHGTLSRLIVLKIINEDAKL